MEAVVEAAAAATSGRCYIYTTMRPGGWSVVFTGFSIYPSNDHMTMNILSCRKIVAQMFDPDGPWQMFFLSQNFCPLRAENLFLRIWRQKSNFEHPQLLWLPQLPTSLTFLADRTYVAIALMVCLSSSVCPSVCNGCIVVKRREMELRLLLITNRKLHIGFRTTWYACVYTYLFCFFAVSNNNIFTSGSVTFAAQASRRYIRTACKCHGLSGSCTLRTCVRRLPALHDVGRRLKARFDDAVQVTVSNADGRTLHPAAAAYSDEDLVYADDSPDYCRPVTCWRYLLAVFTLSLSL